MSRIRSLRIAQAITVWLLLGVLGLLYSPAAYAHANLLHASPASGEILNEPPSQLLFHFSEVLEPDLVDVKLYDDNAELIPLRSLHLQPGNAAMLVAELPLLREGSYRVTASIVSEDGHPVSENLTFSVGRETPLRLPHEHEEDAKATMHDIVLLGARYVTETLLLLGAGLHAVALMSRRFGLPGTQLLLGRLRVTGFVLLLLGTGGEWAAYASSLPAGGLTDALFSGNWQLLSQSPFALMLLIQFVLLLLLSLPSLIDSWYAAVWLLLTANLAIGGHALGTDPLYLSVALRVLHLLAMSVWLGALTYLLALKRHEKRAQGHDESAAQDREGFRARFLRVVLVSAALTAISGVLLANLQTDWTFILTGAAPWSLLLLGKMALMLLMLVPAWYQTLGWRKDVHALSTPLLRTEWRLGLAILLIGVLISQLPYPHP